MYNDIEKTRSATMRMLKKTHGRLSGPAGVSSSENGNDIDALIAENTAAMDKVAAAIEKLMMSEAVKDSYKFGFLSPVTYQDIDITDAQTDLLVTFPPCKWLQVSSDGLLDGITIKLNTQSEQSIDVKDYSLLPVVNATRLYLSNTAVLGRTNLRLTFSQVEPNKVITTQNLTQYVVSASQSIYTSATPPAAGTVYTTVIDCRNAKNIVFRIVNTSDVNITVQAVGNIASSTTGCSYIGVAIPVVATTGIVTVGVNLEGDDWHPYIALEIVIPAGAAAGDVEITETLRS
ncbi:MAG: hypothetical protein PHN44_04345 [Candidatus Marinimicrobia bacterium]|nr:hypothetical protein [Candidatus Neomarinimicrobiota bacterium]